MFNHPKFKLYLEIITSCELPLVIMNPSAVDSLPPGPVPAYLGLGPASAAGARPTAGVTTRRRAERYCLHPRARTRLTLFSATPL